MLARVRKWFDGAGWFVGAAIVLLVFALLAALAILPEYLRSAPGDAGTVIDYRDWQIPLGRRFRALKAWFQLRTEGAGPVRDMIRRHVEWTAEVTAWVDADDRFERAAPPSLNLLCVRHVDGDEATDALIANVNEFRL